MTDSAGPSAGRGPLPAPIGAPGHGQTATTVERAPVVAITGSAARAR